LCCSAGLTDNPGPVDGVIGSGEGLAEWPAAESFLSVGRGGAW